MKYFITLLAVFTVFSLQAQAFLEVPVEGVAGKDYTIVNYLDWSDTDIQDPFCGSKTYDGHQGTDFSIRSFRQMDSSVNILAAAEGKVVFVQDGLFDRETVSDVSKGFGNYIAIKHPNKYFTYYAHLKKGSLKVKVGDEVKAGDVIAEMGSSGNSTDPHLHFEVYFDSMYVVDPFKGNCGNDASLWLDQLPYDTSFVVWETGMHNELVAMDDLRNRINTLDCCPFTFPTNSSQPVLLWSQMYGLRKGSTLTVTWYTPDDQLWFTYDFKMERDWWYYYFWTYINNENLPEGTWHVELEYDGNRVVNQEFEVDKSLTLGRTANSTSDCATLESASFDELKTWHREGVLEIYDVQGRPVSIELLKARPAQNQRAFLLKAHTESGHCSCVRTF